MVRRQNKHHFLDFFAGSGLVCEGLKDYFTPVWANDISAKKAAVFLANHPENILHLGPIENVTGDAVPSACLAWGSFPCQDLSLAGNIEGISSTRSGLVWHWLRVIDEMKRKPPLAVAENVMGLISAGKGKHYRMLHEALVRRGYRAGALVLDAAHWVPQSRKRVFVVAAERSIPTAALEADAPQWCHPLPLVRAVRDLREWIWWSLPIPPAREIRLETLIDANAPSDEPAKRERLLDMIPPRHREKMLEAVQRGQSVFPGYKRIRQGKQVLELRFDGLAGCLRTPEGGSSRQFLVIHSGGERRTRLLTVREAAALMGAPEDYKIPGAYNDGYRAMGDAVAAPVVRYLAKHLLFPLASLAAEERGNER